MKRSSFFGNESQPILTEARKEKILAHFEELGILPIYEKVFAQIEEKSKTTCEELLAKGIPEEQVKAAIKKATTAAQIKAIEAVKDEYLKALKELGKNNEPSSTTPLF